MLPGPREFRPICLLIRAVEGDVLPPVETGNEAAFSMCRCSVLGGTPAGYDYVLQHVLSDVPINSEARLLRRGRCPSGLPL